MYYFATSFQQTRETFQPLKQYRLRKLLTPNIYNSTINLNKNPYFTNNI